MKALLLTILTCLAISFSSYSFSWDRWNCGDDDSGCGQNNCTTCQCTDPGVGRMTASVTGNIVMYLAM